MIIKRNQCLLAGLMMTAVFATVAGNYNSGDGNDITPPPEPGVKYSVQLNTAPGYLRNTSDYGYYEYDNPDESSYNYYELSGSTELFEPGTKVSVRARKYPNYTFKEWRDGTEIKSEQPCFTYKVPSKRSVLTAWYEYTPETPEEPSDTIHRVRIFITPSSGGTVGEQYFIMRRGDRREIYANANPNYRFSGWEINGEPVTPYPDGTPVNPVTLTMRNDNIDCIARFVFDPEAPEEPGTNKFNLTTGELIMDWFKPGMLQQGIATMKRDYKHPDQTYSLSTVKDAIVVGALEGDDEWFARDMDCCTQIDIRRVSGFPTVKEGMFPASVETLMLPACTESVEERGLAAQSANMKTIYCDADVPPAYTNPDATGPEDDYFVGLEEVSKNIRCIVSPESEPLYRNAPGWRHFFYGQQSGNGTPDPDNPNPDDPVIDRDSLYGTVTILLPSDRLSDLKGSRIVLRQRQNNSSREFLVKDNEPSYTFSNIMRSTEKAKTTFSAQLRNSGNEILSTDVILLDPDGNDIQPASSIEVTKERMHPVYRFDKILRSHELSVTVLTPEGKDVTSETSVSWYDGTLYRGYGSTCGNVPEGKTLEVRMSLDSGLARKYRKPANATITSVVPGSADDTNHLTVILDPYDTVVLTGTVTSPDDDNSYKDKTVADAKVTVTRKIPGSSTPAVFETKTDSLGRYKIEIIDVTGKIEITIEKEGCFPTLIEISDPGENPDDNSTEIPISIKRMPKTAISLNLQWKKAVKPGESATPEDFPLSQVGNLRFEVRNEAGGTLGISNRYPVVNINDELSAGFHNLSLTVSGYSSKFAPMTETVTVQNNDTTKVDMTLVEYGGIDVTMTRAEGVDASKDFVAILYGSDGRMIRRYQFTDDATRFSDLPAGTYTVVAMMGSRYFNGINMLEKYGAAGLQETEHYIKKEVTVIDGIISSCDFENVPQFDEASLYRIKVVQLDLNRTYALVGDPVTLRVRALKETKGDVEISNLHLRFELPNDVKYVDGSLMIDNELGDKAGKELTLSGYSGRTYSLEYDEITGSLVRFCMSPEHSGEKLVSVFADYEVGGVRIEQPLGTLLFRGDDYSLMSPARTCRDYVYARGIAPSLKNMTLYANGHPNGSAFTLPNGSWTSKVELQKIGTLPAQTQRIWGVINSGSRYTTSTNIVEYDKNYPELTYVRMIHNGQTVDYDHTRVKTSAKSYSYNPGADIFSLIATFEENKDNVKSLNFHLLNNDGTERIIDGVYAPSRDSWIAAVDYPDSYRLPINVTVDIEYSNGKDSVYTRDFRMGFIAPDVVPVIDPSGFVYEGVESNRVEGVEATIFYREGETNPATGEIEWHAVKWDAEEYAQENPLFTREDGSYAWDVPQGQWQVRFQKEGYETATTAWLPVPPPQLEINVALRRTAAPSLTKVLAYSEDDGVDMEFDTYMNALTLNGDNIYVTYEAAETDGTTAPVILKGEIKPLNNAGAQEEGEPESGSDNGRRYYNRFHFQPDAKLPSGSGTLRLFVSGRVQSYAGVSMNGDVAQDFSLQKKIDGIVVQEAEQQGESSVIFLEMDTDGVTLTVNATPADAARGKTFTVTNDSPDLISIGDDGEKAVYEFDETGRAKITVDAIMKGNASLTFAIDDTDVSAVYPVEIRAEKIGVMKPSADIIGEVYCDSEIHLSNGDSGNDIYYTVDGTEPTVDSHLYKNSITVTGDMSVKAISAVPNASDGESKVSTVASFSYTLRQSNLMTLTLNSSASGLDGKGVTWISHDINGGLDLRELLGNRTDVTRIISQEREAIYDSKYGLIGTLQTLAPAVCYKVESTGATVPVAGVAYNPANEQTLESGWSWIGFPFGGPVNVEEALAEGVASEDDMIVGQCGFAVYGADGWKGDLEVVTPGLGYLYYNASGSAKNLRLNTSVVFTPVSKASTRSSEAPWRPDRYAFPSVMPVTAQVILPDGNMAEKGDVEAGVFCGTECRGAGVFIDGVLMMSVYGNPGDEMAFHVLDKSTGETTVLEQAVVFGDKPLGSLTAPHIIDMRGPSFEADDLPQGFYIDGSTLFADRAISVTIFDTNGMKVLSRRGETCRCIPLDGIAKGFYVVAVETPEGWRYTKIKL